MNERLTWSQIVEKYPGQWVRLEQVERKPSNDCSIQTAIVVKCGGITTQDHIDAVNGKCTVRFVETGHSMNLGIFTAM